MHGCNFTWSSFASCLMCRPSRVGMSPDVRMSTSRQLLADAAMSATVLEMHSTDSAAVHHVYINNPLHTSP